MKLKINEGRLTVSLAVIIGLLILLHFLAATGVIPPEVMWDTTITDTASVHIAGSITVVYLVFNLLTILARAEKLPLKWLRRASEPILWALVVYFFFNMVGAFMSDTGLWKILYGPLYAGIASIVAIFTLATSASIRSNKRIKSARNSRLAAKGSRRRRR